MNSYEEKIKVDEDLVNEFADFSGDYNPLHMDGKYASENLFGRRIAHGMIFGAIISKILGMEYPGKGTIYLEQNLKFIKPIFLNDFVKIKIEILDKKDNKPIYNLSTNVYGTNTNEQDFNDIKIKGEATILNKNLQYI